MRITLIEKLERELRILKEEKAAEEESLKKLEGNQMPSIIILRNMKMMNLAKINQLIRNMEDEIERNVKIFAEAEEGQAVAG